VVGPNREDSLDFSITGLERHPQLMTLIAQCVTAWPTVEIEMAMILGHLLGTKDAAAIAVFEQLRRSSAQREAIMAAANIVLDEMDRELLSASLNAHKAIESERNAFAHGHFGTSLLLQDCMLWMSATDYIPTRSKIVLAQLTPSVSEVVSKIYVYRLSDLKSVFSDIDWLIEHWVNLLKYLRLPSGELGTRGKEYRRLCGQPHIARELTILRQKNSQSKPPQSPSPIRDGSA
jgi:hypothetical protein